MRILVHSRARVLNCICTVLRPDLEYACPVWHSSLTVAQSKALKFLQKRALNIIFPGCEYATNLIIAKVETLSHDDNDSQLFYRWSVIPKAWCLRVMSLVEWPLGPSGSYCVVSDYPLISLLLINKLTRRSFPNTGMFHIHSKTVALGQTSYC